MAITLQAVGTRTSGDAGTTAVAIDRPATGNTAGNTTFVARVIKPSTATAVPQPGWVHLLDGYGGTGTMGDDVGPTRIAIDYQTLAGGESGSEVFTQATSPNSVTGCAVTYSKDPSKVWEIASSYFDVNVHWPYGRTSSAGMIGLNLAAGDVVLAFVAMDTDDTTPFTSPAFTATGMTFTTTQLLGTGGSSQGFDTGLAIFEGVITAGTKANVPIGLTLNGGPASCGATAYVRLREVAAPTAISQAAYGWYGEGTEAASAALVAQNTPLSLPPGVNISTQLRVRLQNTEAVAKPHYRYQLQSRKNGGPWSNLPSNLYLRTDYVDAAGSAQNATLGPTAYRGQTFKGNGQNLTKAMFLVNKSGTPTGDTFACLYATTGPYHNGALPTGPPLATSDIVRSESIPTTQTAITYTFDGTFTLVSGTEYVIVFQISNAVGNLVIGLSNPATASQPYSPNWGNYVIWGGTSWSAGINQRVCCTLFTGPPPSGAVTPLDSPSVIDYQATTRRLTVGTGSFVAGKIGEHGSANAPITASNYTELVFPLSIDTGQLNRGDVLDFRTVLADFPAGNIAPEIPLTYGVTPSLSVATIIASATSNTTGGQWVDVPITPVRLEPGQTYQVDVLLPNGRYPIVGTLPAEAGLINGVTSVYDYTSNADEVADLTKSDGTGVTPVLGAVIPQGSATVTHNWTIAPATGRRITKTASLTATHTWTIAAIGMYHPRYGQATVTHDWTAEATGSTPVSPAVTQASYQFFTNGTEAGAVAIGPQDTAIPGDLANGDGYGQVRIRLQSTSDAPLLDTDDWQLQYELNDSDTWVNAGEYPVLGYDSPSLTQGEATTNRLTGGTGTFAPGKVSKDGVITDLGFAGNSHTELVYSLVLKAAGYTVGDEIKFRVLRNGSTEGMTYASPLARSGDLPLVFIIDSMMSGGTIVTDNFNRANGALGSNWGSVAGADAYAIDGNRINEPNLSSLALAYWAADTFGDDQEIQFTVTTLPLPQTSGCALYLRFNQTTFNGYFVNFTFGASNIHLDRLSGGTPTMLGSTISWTPPAVPFTIKATMVGNTLSAYVNGTLIGTRTDSTFSSGPTVAISGNHGTSAIFYDDFIGGDYDAGGPSLPVIEPFTYSNGALETVASLNWFKNVGLMNVSGNAVVGALGDAIYHNKTSMGTPDHYAKAAFNVGSGEIVGLYLRCADVTTTGSASGFYISYQTTGITVYMTPSFGAAASDSVTGPSSGVLEASVVGSAITVKVDGVTRLSFTNSSIPTGNYVGIQLNSWGATSIDNFEAGPGTGPAPKTGSATASHNWTVTATGSTPAAAGPTTVLDDFNRAGPGLGSNWTVLPSKTAPTIVSNGVESSTSVATGMYWSANTFGADQFAQYDILAGTYQDHILLRYDPATGNGYLLARDHGNDTTYFTLLVGGSPSGGYDGRTTTSPTKPYTWKVQIVGDTITEYINGVAAGTWTKTTYSSGPRIGIAFEAWTPVQRIDNFTGGDVGPPPVASLGSTTEAASTSGTTLTVAAPPGITGAADQKVILAMLFVAAPAATTLTPPSGFTAIGSQYVSTIHAASSISIYCQLFESTANHSAATDFTVTANRATVTSRLMAGVVNQTSGANVIGWTSRSAVSDDSPLAIPSVTTTAANELLVVWGIVDSPHTVISPSGFTNATVSGTNQTFIQLSSMTQATAGASATPGISASTTANNTLMAMTAGFLTSVPSTTKSGSAVATHTWTVAARAPFTDDFNRAGPALGSRWEAIASAALPVISSNKAVDPGEDADTAARVLGLTGEVQISAATITLSSDYSEGGAMAHVTSVTSSLMAVYTTDGTHPLYPTFGTIDGPAYQLYRLPSTMLAEVAAPNATATRRILLATNGTAIEMWVDGVRELFSTDNVIPRGNPPGFTIHRGEATGTSITADDYAARVYTTAPAAPTITSFAPTSGVVGATITVTGTGFFTDATQVTVGGTKVKITATSATTGTFVVPAVAAGAGTATLLTPFGTDTEPFTVTVRSGSAVATHTWTVTPATGKRLMKSSITSTHNWTITPATGRRYMKSNSIAASHNWTIAPATGKRIMKSSPVSTHTWTITPATGKRVTRGQATSTHTWTVSPATGLTPILGVKQGTAIANHTWTVTPATGKRITKTASLTASHNWTVSPATGRKVMQSSITSSHTWTIAPATGKRIMKSSATSAHNWTITPATGKRITKTASLTASHLWTLFAQGLMPIVGVKQGTATARHDWTVTPSTGKRTTKGQATASHTWTTTAAGKKPQRGQATSTHTWTIAPASGKRVMKSSVTASWIETIVATGKRVTKSNTVTASHLWTLLATGVRPVVGVKQGTAIARHDWTVAPATGKRTTRGQATASWTATVTAQGVRPSLAVKQGSAVVTWIETITVTDKKYPKALTVVTWTETITATGQRHPVGSALVQYQFYVDPARGAAGLVGVINGWWNGPIVALQYGDQPIMEWMMVE